MTFQSGFKTLVICVTLCKISVCNNVSSVLLCQKNDVLPHNPAIIKN